MKSPSGWGVQVSSECERADEKNAPRRQRDLAFCQRADVATATNERIGKA